MGADRHVAAQVHLHRIVKELGETSFEIPSVVLVIDLITDIPITPNPDFAVLDAQCMAWQQLLDASE